MGGFLKLSSLLILVALSGTACAQSQGATTPSQSHTSPSPSPSPPPIGDACLVGKWVVQSEDNRSGYAYKGQVVPVSGGQGSVITFGADGTETDDLNMSQPLIGTYNGQQLRIVERGIATFQVIATGTSGTESGPAVPLPTTEYLNGVQDTTFSGHYTASSFTYTCSASKLQIEYSTPPETLTLVRG